MTGRTAGRVALSLGYLALGAGVAAAHGAPPAGYELSLYAATPDAFWVGLAAAVAAAGVGLVPGVSRPTRLAAAALVVLAGIALVALPLVRGYYYFGAGDSLTHLGWARELADGSLSPWRLLYPGVHELAVALGGVAGVPLRRTMLLAVLVLVGLFLGSLPLAVRRLADRRGALVVGAFVAVLLVPFNLISTHLTVHASSQAIAFVPVVLLLVLTYLDGPGERALATPVTGVGALLALTAVATVLFHPQQAANLIVVFAAVAGVQFLARVLGTDGAAATQRPLYAQTAVLLAAFGLWTPRFERTGRNLSTTAYNVLSDTGGSEVVSGKSTSLTAVGGSIPELFVKLFLVDAVLSALAGIAILAAVVALLRGGRVAAVGRGSAVDRWLVVQFGAALVGLSGMFLLMYVGGPGDMYFRYQGFLMVPVSVLAGAVLVHLRAGAGLSGRLAAVGPVAVVVVLLVVVPLSAAAAFPSPYVYQPNPQVTEADYEGHADAFSVREPGREFTGIRGGPVRHVDAVYGTERARSTLEFPGYDDAVRGPFFGSGLGCRFPNTRYLVVDGGAYGQEVDLYRGLRYNRTGFRLLETDPGVNRVLDNGGFALYYLYGDGRAAVCEDDADGRLDATARRVARTVAGV